MGKLIDQLEAAPNSWARILHENAGRRAADRQTPQSSAADTLVNSLLTWQNKFQLIKIASYMWSVHCENSFSFKTIVKWHNFLCQRLKMTKIKYCRFGRRNLNFKREEHSDSLVDDNNNNNTINNNNNNNINNNSSQGSNLLDILILSILA